MLTETHISSSNHAKSTSRPVLTTYDSGFEHSAEHLLEVRCMVEEENRRPTIRRRTPVEKAAWEAAIPA